jgi:hypothetical protein
MALVQEQEQEQEQEQMVRHAEFVIEGPHIQPARFSACYLCLPWHAILLHLDRRFHASC